MMRELKGKIAIKGESLGAGRGSLTLGYDTARRRTVKPRMLTPRPSIYVCVSLTDEKLFVRGSLSTPDGAPSQPAMWTL